MKVLQVHDVDLIGRNFNGYDLQVQLNQRGISCMQLVKKKYSSDIHVVEMASRSFVEQQLLFLENTLSLNNMFPPYRDAIESSGAFGEADIVHYHMIHHYLLSIMDFPKLADKKRSVWTVHDPWVVTGHCVHPLSCEKWKTGCENCDRIAAPFKLDKDNASQLWKLKKVFFADLNIDIVVSSKFMENYLAVSPLTQHLTRIHRIPFGIELEPYLHLHKDTIRRKRKISTDKTIVGFRLDDNEIKGNRYIWEMLETIEDQREYLFISIGKGNIPQKIRERVQIIEWGWTNEKSEIEEFHTACDIFLMPSLAESFGVMALEAMAAKSIVISFKNTVVEEITFAPECGIAVNYADSQDLFQAVAFLHNNKDEMEKRGIRSRQKVSEQYRFCDYIDNHVKLYEEMMER